MPYNTTNYYTDNGTLYINGAALTQMEEISDSTADTVAKLVTDFNALLAALKAAGLMASGD